MIKHSAAQTNFSKAFFKLYWLNTGSLFSLIPFNLRSILYSLLVHSDNLVYPRFADFNNTPSGDLPFPIALDKQRVEVVAQLRIDIPVVGWPADPQRLLAIGRGLFLGKLLFVYQFSDFCFAEVVIAMWHVFSFMMLNCCLDLKILAFPFLLLPCPFQLLLLKKSICAVKMLLFAKITS